MTNLICEVAAETAGLNVQELQDYLNIAIDSAKLGGHELMNNYRQIINVRNKGRKGDLVTDADLSSEKIILDKLNQDTPEISILAEESGLTNNKNALTWCIDPLDGTTNFAHGYPLFATSIGLIYNNMPILGAIYAPFINEIYFAAPGIGSFCNDQKINVSTTKSLEDSLLVTGFAYDRKTTIENNYAEFCWLTHLSRGVRRGGAAAVDLAFIACGRVDAYWERGLSKWDLAAGIPIVELAGGVISNYPNGNFDLSTGRILASNPLIQNELKKELSKINPLEKRFFCSQDI